MHFNFKIFFLSLLLGCGNKEPPPPPVELIFQVPLAIEPTRMTYTVGDTLWLSASFSNQIQEINTNQRYIVTPDNFDLRTHIGIRQLVYSNKYFSEQPGAQSKFKFIHKVGDIAVLGPTFGSIKYEYNKEMYNARIGIIPLDTGTFSLNFLNGWGVKRSNEPWPNLSFINLPTTTDGNTQQASYLTTFYYINEGNNNFNLLQKRSQLTSFTNPIAMNINYEQEATYTFIID